MSEWQTETLPPYGQRVLGLIGKTGSLVDIVIRTATDAQGECWVFARSGDRIKTAVRYWMPLPEIPAA